MFRCLLSAAVALGLVLAVRADLPVAVKVTVTGGTHDVENAIIAIPMPAIKLSSVPVFTFDGLAVPVAHQFLERGRLDKGEGKPELLIVVPKLKAGQTAVWVTEQAVQILGGYGYIKDFPVGKWYRDAKIYTIFEGTSEIQRLVIARNLLESESRP